MNSGRAVLPAALASLLVVFTLFCLTGYHVTGRTAATRMLSRLGVALVELDRWLPAHEDDLDLLAQDQPQGSVPLNDFPIAVRLPASAVVDADAVELRSLIVSAMGRELYNHGTSALRDSEGQPASLSFTEPVRWTVNLLEKDRHRLWQAALPTAVLLLFAVEALVLSNGGSAVAPLLIGSVLAAVAAVAAWLLAALAGPAFDSPVDREIMLLLRDSAWIGLRNSLAVLLAAGSLVLLSNTFGGVLPQRRPAKRTGPDTGAY